MEDLNGRPTPNLHLPRHQRLDASLKGKEGKQKENIVIHDFNLRIRILA